jgi:hypothetical protein
LQSLAVLDFSLESFPEYVDGAHEVGVVVDLVEDKLEILCSYTEFKKIRFVGVAYFFCCPV